MFDCISILGALALVLNAGTAWAHPGHGDTGAATALHYISDPFHGTAAIAALIAVGCFARRRAGRMRAALR